MVVIQVNTANFEYMGLKNGMTTSAMVTVSEDKNKPREAFFNYMGRDWHLIEPHFFVVEALPTEAKTSSKKATEFLSKALSLLEERGKDYDQPEGERSMGRTVTAFNAITGHSLKESDGWLILQILKDVRQNQNRDSYHADSAEDCISYAALKAEALAENK